MPAKFSWFPGTREHRFLYVHQGWIKVKAEHHGARGSHLLPLWPGLFGLMILRCVDQICRTSFKILFRIEKFFRKKGERNNPTTAASGDLAHSPGVQNQSRGLHKSCSSGMSWRVGGNWCKSKLTRALSCSASPFSQALFWFHLLNLPILLL